MSCHPAPPKSVAIESISWLGLVLLLLYRVRGFSCWYLNVSTPLSIAHRLAIRTGLQQIDLAKPYWLCISTHSYAEVNYAIHDLLGESYERGIFRGFCQVPGEWSTPPIQVVLGHRLSRSKPELFALHVWAKSLGPSPGRVLCGRQENVYVLRRMQPSIQVRLSMLLAVETNVAQMVHVIKKTIAQLVSKRNSIQHPAPRSSCESANSLHVTAIGIFNNGPQYTSLYRYSNLFDEEWLAAISGGLVQYFVNPEALEGNDCRYAPWPIASLTPTMAMRIVWTWLCSLRRARRLMDARLLWFACEYEQRLAKTASIFKAKYPKVRTSMIAFDMQIPPVLLFALARCGVRSFSFQERPSIPVDQGAFVAADVVLSASPWFSERLKESWSYAFREVSEVGMWRTDPIVKEPASVQKPGVRQVLLLPYVPVTDGPHVPFPISSSVASVKHFILDTIELALKFKDYRFVLRAKSIEWLNSERFADIRDRISEADNYVVSRDYGELNGSYSLLSQSTAVLCKPTSLGEEALACGIPTIFHDYTHNSSGYHENIWTHIPKSLWVQSRKQLDEMMEHLIRRGSSSDDAWRRASLDVFGTLNDGTVQERSRLLIENWSIKLA